MALPVVELSEKTTKNLLFKTVRNIASVSQMEMAQFAKVLNDGNEMEVRLI
jgi:hypothetical protein